VTLRNFSTRQGDRRAFGRRRGGGFEQAQKRRGIQVDESSGSFFIAPIADPGFNAGTADAPVLDNKKAGRGRFNFGEAS
jgi:hypothetical protein